MKLHELIFGALSIVSFILAFKIEDNVYKVLSILIGLFILIVVYLSSSMDKIKGIAESSKNEIKKLNEKVKVYEKLTELDIRIKNLEKGGAKK